MVLKDCGCKNYFEDDAVELPQRPAPTITSIPPQRVPPMKFSSSNSPTIATTEDVHYVDNDYSISILNKILNLKQTLHSMR